MDAEKLISHFGGQVKAAKVLGVSQPTIASWKKSGIPFLRQLDIERRTNRKFRAIPKPKVGK